MKEKTDTADLVTTEVTKEFSFDLTKEEMALKGREIQSYRRDIAKEDNEFEERKQTHKATLTRLENNINRAITIISEGKETRAVTAKMIKNLSAGTVEFWYDTTLMEERPLTAQERQLEMGPVLVKGRTDQTAETTTEKPQTPSDIAQVIKEETNSRTKHSGVDGPTNTPPDSYL